MLELIKHFCFTVVQRFFSVIEQKNYWCIIKSHGTVYTDCLNEMLTFSTIKLIVKSILLYGIRERLQDLSFFDGDYFA